MLEAISFGENPFVVAAGQQITVIQCHGFLIMRAARSSSPGLAPRGQVPVRSPAHPASRRYAEAVAATHTRLSGVTIISMLDPYYNEEVGDIGSYEKASHHARNLAIPDKS